MSLFEGIGFQNFRVFRDKTYFDFAPITLITGTNNSGKSGLLNGIKLLQENFKNIKKAREPKKELNLEAIMLTTIDSKSLLEKYGTLNQFITRNGKKNEFQFLFRRKMVSINDEVEISFTLKVNENPIKDAYIRKVSMKSISSGKIIFNIDKLNNQAAEYAISLDFIYFFDALNQRISKSIGLYTELNKLIRSLPELKSNLDIIEKYRQSLKLFNDVYKTNYVLYKGTDGYSIDEAIHFPDEAYFEEPAYISTKVLKALKAEQEGTTRLYNFSFLWASNSEFKVKYEKIIKSFYKTVDTNSFAMLNRDILKFLSNINWHLLTDSIFFNNGIDFIINSSNHTLGIGLKKFTEVFTNSSRRPNIISVLSNSKQTLEIIEENIKPAISKSPVFYEKVFKPLLHLIAESHLTRSEVLREKTHRLVRHDQTVFDNLIPLEIEKQLNDLIMVNINIIQNCITGLNEFNFLPTNKTQNRRSYSLSDTDEFTQLIKKLETMPSTHRKKAYGFINKWLKEFDIADSFIIKHDMDTGNFKPYLKVKDREFLLADFGFGTTQVLPLLLKIIPEGNDDYEIYGGITHAYNSRIVVLEEPEANLHPALQSKLADLIVESSKKFNIQIVVETHSEYLIRKLQYLTVSAKSNLSAGATIIYYFYHPDKIPPGENQIKKINILKDGTLANDFGTGFFDESDNIAMSIWSMNKSQKN